MSILTREVLQSVSRPGFHQIQNIRRIPRDRYWLSLSKSGEFATIDIRETRNSAFSLGFINLANGTPQYGYFKGEKLSRSDLQTLTIS